MKITQSKTPARKLKIRRSKAIKNRGEWFYTYRKDESLPAILTLEVPNMKIAEGMKFQRIRRITGYLVGDKETRFNDAKKAEERDRVKHGMEVNKHE